MPIENVDLSAHSIALVAEIDLSDLAFDLSRKNLPREVLLNFILELDGYVADYDFTLVLRDELSATIQAEDDA